MKVEWKKVTSELPPIGEDVLVFLRGECFDVYAVAHLEEDVAGEKYWWESSEDAVQGLQEDGVVCWAAIPEAPKELKDA